jgi:hypothetical protein
MCALMGLGIDSKGGNISNYGILPMLSGASIALIAIFAGYKLSFNTTASSIKPSMEAAYIFLIIGFFLALASFLVNTFINVPVGKTFFKFAPSSVCIGMLIAFLSPIIDRNKNA